MNANLVDLIDFYKNLSDPLCGVHIGTDQALPLEKMLMAFVNSCYIKAGVCVPGLQDSVFWEPEHHEFYEVGCNPDVTTMGLIESGESMIRADFAYELGVAALCEKIYETGGFHMSCNYNFLPESYHPGKAAASIPGIMEQYMEYSGGDELPESVDEAQVELANSRTAYQFWTETLPERFSAVADELLKTPAIQEKLSCIREDFVSEYSDDFGCPLVFIWNDKVPEFLKWDRSIADNEDMPVLEAIDLCLETLDSFIAYGLDMYQTLLGDEICAWVYQFEDEDSASYNGVFAGTLGLKPRFLLTPLVLNMCFEYLADKYDIFEKEEVPAA